jgi:hypothetical protein
VGGYAEDGVGVVNIITEQQIHSEPETTGLQALEERERGQLRLLLVLLQTSGLNHHRPGSVLEGAVRQILLES